jgi:adenine-specific DNA-methyltransferase
MKEIYQMTDDIYETPSTTPNFQTELAALLADLIPEAIADGKVDIEKLKELLGSDTADSSERFGLFWPGKKRALRAAQEPTTATLRPDFENSKDWGSTQNIFIEGDNLEVLKILQKHYHAKVKLIYIDPPYNTGKDFVYPDNYKEGLDTYLEWTRQVNDEGKKVSTNSETEGRYHSNWLNMMYPRLKLARNLLADDGVIFISIDDNEVSHLRKLCDEVFGVDQFAAQIIWKKRNTPPNDRVIGAQHDYILAYVRKDLGAFNLRLRNEEQIARYKNPDNHAKGPWVAGDLTSNVKGGRYSAGLNYAITNPRTGQQFWPANNGNWRFNQQRVAELILADEIYFGKDDSASPKLKRFLVDVKEGTTWTTLWDFAPFNTSGSLEMQEILGSPTIFDSPKPVGLIELLLKAGSTPNCIVLDFFAGSGTTAHAVMELNAEDGGNRQYIQVQLPEPTSEGSEARRAGFKTIADIGRKRIDVAGAKIQEQASAVLDTRERPLDIGFRAYKLIETNFTKWRVSSEIDLDQLQERLLGLRDSSSADDATSDDLLNEILLKQGYSLTERIVPVEIAGLDVRSVLQPGGDVGVLAYLNERVKPNLEQLRAIVDADPQRIIVLEDAFQGDDELKTNLVQLAKSKGIELWTA